MGLIASAADLYSLDRFLIAAFVGALVYNSYLVVWRLLLHPLSKFPGPRIAAATYLYEVWWDYFRDGAYLWEIDRMHQKYGPIVRVNPEELSIQDPAFYGQLYVHGNVRRTNAHPAFGDGMDFNGSHGMTVSHDHHRLRRKPLEIFFSKQSIVGMEGMLRRLVSTLVGRLEEFRGSEKVVRLDHAFAAFAGDVIGNICVGESHVSLCEEENFSPEWFQLFHTLIRSMPIFMNFPWIIRIVRLLPSWLLQRIDPRSRSFRSWREMAESEIGKAKDRKANGGCSIFDDSPIKAATLFDHLVNSDLPKHELGSDRLASEAQVLMGAGTVTTAQSLSHLTVYILSNKAIEINLRKELKEIAVGAPGSIPPINVLDNLPYLQACIKEGLRLSCGLVHRLPRCSPDFELNIQGWTIPRGTPVGMSAYYMHTNAEVYDDPFDFRPERWLANSDPKLSHNFVPFTKGSRACLGQNLAYAEMSVAVAALFAPWSPELELYHTDTSDVDPACAFLLPLPRLDSKGVRVMVK